MPCFERLVITKRGIEAMNNEAYEEERNKIKNAIAQKVEQAIEGERFVWYSAYKYDSNGIIIDIPTPFSITCAPWRTKITV
jgi:hypothetical protein